MTGQDGTEQDGTGAGGDRPSARELVRRRSRSYAQDETGRHHHIGAAPELQPVLGEDGVQYVGTSDVQLAARTVVQLEQQRARLDREMAAAAQDLRFEDAARLRDDLSRVTVELARRREEPDLG